MTAGSLTRRAFLTIGAIGAAGAAFAGRAVAGLAPRAASGPRTIFRLSLRGRRGSTAAKLHNANFRFATAATAAAHRAHLGDNSRVVSMTVSGDEFDRLFTGRNSDVADLRLVGGPAIVGDCNRDGAVAINELILGVRIALDQATVAECTPFDRVADGKVTIAELVRGVGNALRRA